ncbi:NUDIX hydrolase N-terminal domain-containing protein [Faecalicoccus pleomorphus]|uniref:NUDIX hydrolase N-terminal domain-containing protein n=1 Tax=Faecalicoccus pleomorphus TaxID=1323 RepID=UPI0034C5D529
MDKQNQWIQWAIELQSLAQAGLTYGKDVFDQERYQRIREISAEIISNLSDIPYKTVVGLFCNEIGYQSLKLIPVHQSFEMIKSFLLKKMMENGHCRVDGVM